MQWEEDWGILVVGFADTKYLVAKSQNTWFAFCLEDVSRSFLEVQGASPQS